MVQETKQFTIIATFFTIFLFSFQLFPMAICDTRPIIPSNDLKLDKWIDYNVKKFKERKSELNHTGYKSPQMNSNLDGAQMNSDHLDEVLAVAEAGVKVITVKKDGSGNFLTVTDAINSIPKWNTNRVVIKISKGWYWEKVTIDKSKRFITLYGEDPNDMPKIFFNGTAAQYGTLNSATFAVESDYFVAVNIIFLNSAPMPDKKRAGAQAVAMRISGDKATFDNCKFIGYQDTLCDDKGKHIFRNCYIQGTMDFIFGNGQSLYLNTSIRSVSNGGGIITAHGRQNDNEESGFVFVQCSITGTGKVKLGRAWRQSSRVIYAYTYMDTLINSKGWSDGMNDNEHKPVYYGEYKCYGPGANSSGRAKFVKILSDGEAKPFLSISFLDGNKWILPPPKV